jgi:hypothetical protein
LKNIPKFFKLREYVILDRAIALVHVYARHETELGRFLYFTKKKKEKLYYWFKKTKRRDYKKFKSFNGSFSQALPLVLDEVEYDKKKDAAIMTLSKDKKTLKEEQLMKELQYRITRLLQYDGLNEEIVTKELGISKHMLDKWKDIGNTDAAINRKVMLREKFVTNGHKYPVKSDPHAPQNEVFESVEAADKEFIQNPVRDDDGVVSSLETTTQKPRVESINIDKPGFYISSEPRDASSDANTIEDGYDGDDKDKPMPKDKFKPDEDEGLDDL